MRLPFVLSAVAVLSQAAFVRQAATISFVTTDDKDTIAVEQITRTAATLTGDLGLVQQGTHTHYVVHLRTDGSPERVEVINDARGFFTGTIAFDAIARNSARAGGGGLSDKIIMAPPGAYPTIGTSVALMDQLVRRTHLALGDSAMLPVINIRNRNTGLATLKRIAADSVRVYCDGCMNRGAIEELRFAIAKDGGIAGGTSPSQHWVIARR
ncbi:MAG: hypothetical protein JWM41_3834 [Gemmatimonadetes bacterium]|nr:hypothetical protein [Gemmatimonadota bacterium]